MSLGNEPVQMMPYLTPEAAQIYKNLMAYMGPMMGQGASAFPGQLNAAPDPNQIAGNDLISKMMGKGSYKPNAYSLTQNVKVPQKSFGWLDADPRTGGALPGPPGPTPPNPVPRPGGYEPVPMGGGGEGPVPMQSPDQMMALMQAINNMYNPQGY